MNHTPEITSTIDNETQRDTNTITTPEIQEDIIIDSEFKKLLPPQTPEEHEALKQSLQTEGCRDSLMVWQEENILIDGHNRYAICKKLGIQYRIHTKSFETRDQVKIWMLQNQRSRRNMTTFQRVETILKLKSSIAEEAKRKQRASGGAVPQKSAEPAVETRKVLAQKAGVSHDTMKKVEYILGNADNYTMNHLRRGINGITINSVYSQLKKSNS